jgi:hypothetical protein
MWPASDGWGGGPLSPVDDSSVVRGGEGLTDSCRQGNQVAPTGTGWYDLLPGEMGKTPVVSFLAF